MRSTTLPRLVLVLGVLVLGLTLARWTQLVPDRSPASHDHDHGEAAALPPPTYPETGPDRRIPDHGPLPDFQLLDSRGAPLTRDRLLGGPWVASFLFTHCGGTCPSTTARVRILQLSLPEGTLLVSFSVDPTRDTPEVLARFAEANGRLEGRWLFATGTPEAMEHLTVAGFHLGEPGQLLHDTRLALVDSRAHLRGRYESTDEKAMSHLLRDLALLRQASR